MSEFQGELPKMRRYQLAGAVIAGILFIAANAAAAYATMQNPAKGENASGFHLAEDVVSRKEDEKLRPVQLICPVSISGTLIEISVSQYGLIEKYQVEYGQNKPVMMSLFLSEKRAPPKQIVRLKILDRKTKSVTKSEIEESELGKILSEHANDLLKKICKGPETARRKYRAALKGNLHTLGLPADEYPSNF